MTLPGVWQIFANDNVQDTELSVAAGFPDTQARAVPTQILRTTSSNGSWTISKRSLGARVDYVVADQFGNANGRFHQHCLLAAPGLGEYSRESIWQWLKKQRLEFNRILPFENEAAFYISRYVGRDAYQS